MKKRLLSFVGIMFAMGISGCGLQQNPDSSQEVSIIESKAGLYEQNSTMEFSDKSLDLPPEIPLSDTLNNSGTMPQETRTDEKPTKDIVSTGQTGESENFSQENIQEDESQMIYAHIGDETLKILPADNSSAQALIELLKEKDITVNMHDYGNFEKVGGLGSSLPTNDEDITTKAGDVILYQGNQITIYYDQNTWNFTKLGEIQELTQAQLKTILGEEDVSVRFSLKSE